MDKQKFQEAFHDNLYPLYHLAPPSGWLNDPNGLCQMNGIYHFYFQYAPESAEGGLKYWGHYQSPDFVNWTYTGAVLAPDCTYDKDGVYSGSALREDGKIYLYYTGNAKEEGNHDYVYSGRQANTMLVTTEDGHHMSEKKCLMTNADYPADLSCHVRDPKVFKEDGAYYMVQGARTKEDKGVILLFQSLDKVNWTYHSRLQTTEKFGYMWECPDLFSLGDLKILSLSPQGLKKEEYRFQNQYQSGYFLVNGDYKNEKEYELLSFREWDMGFDFYAPQTFLDEKGRRILVGWAGMVDCSDEYDNQPTVEKGWQHMFTLPRELTVKNNIIYQMPVEEIRNLRTKEEKIESTEFLCSTLSEISVENMENEDMEIKLGEGLSLIYEKETQIFSMKFHDETGRGRRVRRALLKKLETLDIFMDQSIIEVYINEGLYVFTSRFYPKTDKLRVSIHGGKNLVNKWCMKAFHIKNK